MCLVQVNATNVVFILDTMFLRETDRPRAFAKEKQLASSLLEKDIYQSSNIKIGIGRNRQPTELILNKNTVKTLLNTLTVSDTVNLQREIKEATILLSDRPSNIRKSIILFTVGSKYNAYPDLLKKMKEESIKLILVDVNNALSPPIPNPPFAAAPTDLPDIVKPEPETSEIATIPFTGRASYVVLKSTV